MGNVYYFINLLFLDVKSKKKCKRRKRLNNLLMFGNLDLINTN